MIEFINETSFTAKLFRVGDVRRDGMLAAVIARPCFQIENGQLSAIDEVLWPVENAPFQTQVGEIKPDRPHLNGGVDLLIFGEARPMGGGAVKQLMVNVRAGSRFERTIQVSGDRFWKREGDDLVISEPTPFESMPMDQSRAFGGVARHDEMPVPWNLNTTGRGFYLDEEAAVEQPLPNLEDPEDMIHTIEDRPDPICFGLYEGGLRSIMSTEVDLSDINQPKLKRVKPTLFNLAHPKFVIPASDAPQAGDTVRIENVSTEGPIEFKLPTLPMEVGMTLGQRRFAFPLHIDQIGLFCDDRKVFLSYKVCFRYRNVVGEKRLATLRIGSSTASASLIPNQ